MRSVISVVDMPWVLLYSLVILPVLAGLDEGRVNAFSVRIVDDVVAVHDIVNFESVQN